uniref:DUF4351 domain-containing protein n=1 Tax=Candidatus Magnetaquicoccus inordinatus TaxID=2496818 RepID=UPI00102CA9D1
ITREADSANRRLDLLSKVWLLDGGELWVLIHVEIQGDRTAGFAERMYTCQYRVHDLYRKPVVGLAILADEDASWRVTEYRQALWGSELIYRFNAVKLLDYLDRLPELEGSRNPFAVVTMAHLSAKQTRNRPDDRYQVKWRITRNLYQHGFSKQEIIDLYRFIDWVLTLSEEADNRFWEELSNYEEKQAMPFVTSVERIGIQKGIQQGLLQGIQQGLQQGLLQGKQQGQQEGGVNVLLRLLHRRFGEVPDATKAMVRAADLAQLENWTDRILEAKNLDDVFAH